MLSVRRILLGRGLSVRLLAAIRWLAVRLLRGRLPISRLRSIWLLRRRRRAVSSLLWRRVVLAGRRAGRGCGAVRLRRRRSAIGLGRGGTVGLLGRGAVLLRWRRLSVALTRLLVAMGRRRRTVLLGRRLLLVVPPLLGRGLCFD